MKIQITKIKKGNVVLAAAMFFSVFAATAFGQITVSQKSLQLMTEMTKLNARRDVAYDMGVNIGFGVYQAEITQTEFANKNSKIYGPAMNLRSQAFAKARADAETINAILSAPSDKLDVQQFLQYSDGYSHEKDALKVAKDIELKIEMGLKKINDNLFEAFILGYATGVAEANASSNSELRRPYISNFLSLSNEYGKKMKIYNPAGGTLQKLAEGKTPISELYPKIVSLRTWYAGAAAALK